MIQKKKKARTKNSDQRIKNYDTRLKRSYHKFIGVNQPTREKCRLSKRNLSINRKTQLPCLGLHQEASKLT